MIVIHTVSANFTRPADTTAYASGDLVANSTTAGSVTPMSFSDGARSSQAYGLIRKARLKKSDGTDVANASFRLHLYTSSPTCTNGDNGAWLTTHSGWLGAIDITTGTAFSDAAGGNGAPNFGSEMNFRIGGGTIYGLLEARGAYSPASEEVFTVTLEIVQG